MPFRAVVRALILVIACATNLAAQEEFEQPKRLSMTIGGALGSAGISCVPKCSADRQSGPSVLLRGAGQLSAQFSITLEGSVWSQGISTPNGDGRWTLSWYLLGAQWHPNEEEDFFLTAGVGLGTGKADVTFPDVGALPLNFNNVGGAFGVGRDVRVTTDIAVTGYLEYRFILRSQALIGRANSGARVAADVVSAGLAITLF